MVFFSGKLAAHRASGFADDEFRLHADGFRMTDVFRTRNSFQQSLRLNFAHSAQRLANRRQTKEDPLNKYLAPEVLLQAGKPHRRTQGVQRKAEGPPCDGPSREKSSTANARMARKPFYNRSLRDVDK